MFIGMSAGTLHVHVWGEGDRHALLLHGQFGDGRMWWEVAPVLAAEGYRVLCVDLPGHGLSPRSATATVEATVQELLRVCPRAELAIGHSLGGLILAHGAVPLGVERAVFVDTPLRLPPGRPEGETRRLLEEVRSQRTLEWLTVNRPHWCDRDREIEAEAAELFDVGTALSLVGSLRGAAHPPPSGVRSLAILPEPSEHVSAEDVEQLQAAAVEVRTVPGAGHTVWYGYVPEFLEALTGWL